MEIICGNCAFCEQQDAQYVCVRFPPVPHVIPTRNALGDTVPSVIAMRPNVQKYWYCGEFTSDTLSNEQVSDKLQQGGIQ